MVHLEETAYWELAHDVDEEEKAGCFYADDEKDEWMSGNDS